MMRQPKEFDAYALTTGVVFLLHSDKQLYLPADQQALTWSLVEIAAVPKFQPFLKVLGSEGGRTDCCGQSLAKQFNLMIEKGKIYLDEGEQVSCYRVCSNSRLSKKWVWENQHLFNDRQLAMLREFGETLFWFSHYHLRRRIVLSD